MNYKLSLKKTLAGIMAIAIVAGMQPGILGGTSGAKPIVANAEDTVKTTVTVTEENAAEVLADMQANTVYEISGSLSVPFIRVKGEGVEIQYTGSAAGTITTTDENSRGIYVESNASLSISRNSKAFTIDMSGSKDAQATIDDDASITVNTGITIMGTIAYFQNSIVNITGGTVSNPEEGGFAISGNHDWSEGSVLNISSGTVKAANGIAIYHPQAGTVNITGGTITGKTALFARTGEINISGGTLTGTGDVAEPGTIANGAEPTGDCVVAQSYSSSYGAAPVLNITGGSFTSTNGQAIAAYKMTEDEDMPDITISGGSFKNGSEPADVSQFYPDDGIEYIQDGTGKLFDASTVVMEYTTLAGVLQYKTSFTSSSISSSGTYKLLTDVSLTQRLAPGTFASDVTIDLNGHNFTSAADDYAVLLSRAGSESAHKSFKFINTSDTPSVVQTNTAPSVQSIQIQGKYNDFTLGENVKLIGDICILSENDNVDIYGEVELNGDSAIATNGSFTKNAVINIHEGAVINTDSIGIYQPSSTSVLNIEGGTITGSTPVYVKSGELNISGGTLHATGAKADYQYNGNGCYSTGDALVLESSASGYGGNPVANITGGSFISDNADAIGIYKSEDTPFDDPELEVSGGTFSTEVDEEDVPVGYRVNYDETTSLYSVDEDLNEYVLSFDSNGGTGEMEPLTGRYKEKVTLPDCTFDAPFEKKFTGWVIGDETCQPGDEVALTENISASAVWEDAKLRQSIAFNVENVEKTFGDGPFQIVPTGAQTDITYASSDENVLTVAEDGTVTIVGGGDAYITATAEETDEYFSATARYDVSVAQASYSITASINDWTYGDEPSEVSIEGNISGETPVIEYKDYDADDSEYTEGLPSDAGEYWIRVTIPENNNYIGVFTETLLTIAPAIPEGTITPAEDLEYTGQPQALFSEAVCENGTVLFSVNNGDTWDEEIPSFTDADTYTVLYKIAGNGPNYDHTLPTTVNVTIAQKTLGFEWGDTALIYNGEEQAPEVILDGVVPGDTCEVYISGAKTEPGTYIAKITGINNENYILGDGELMTAFSITKDEYTVIIDANGGSGDRVKLRIGGEYELLPYEDYGFTAPENKKFVCWNIDGEEFQPGESIDITDVTLIQAVWEDAKLYQEDLAFDDNKVEKTFGDEPFVNELFGAMTDVSFASSDENVATVDENGNVTIVGAGSAVITASAAESDDYFAAEASYRMVVAKAAITPAVTIEGWIEGDPANAPEITGNPGDADVTIEYKAADAEDFSPEAPSAPGSYTVRATVAESANYLGGTAEAEFTVEEAAPLSRISFKHNCSFDSDLSMYYAVAQDELDGFSNISLTVEMEVYAPGETEPTIVSKTITDYTEMVINSANYYMFEFSGIAATDMGSKLSATLSADKDGETFTSSVDEYSIKEYALDRLEKSTKASYKKMMVDMLNYGTAAQIHFDKNVENLVNADLTADQLALGTQTLPELRNNENTITLDGATVQFGKKNIAFENRTELMLQMQFPEDMDMSKVKLNISYETSSGESISKNIAASNFTKKSGYYIADFDKLAITDVRSKITFKVMNGSEQISDTLEYSVESYVVNRLANSTSETYKALITEMMKFGISAEEHFSS